MATEQLISQSYEMSGFEVVSSVNSTFKMNSKVSHFSMSWKEDDAGRSSA